MGLDRHSCEEIKIDLDPSEKRRRKENTSSMLSRYLAYDFLV
jgi:hypothetical protein